MKKNIILALIGLMAVCSTSLMAEEIVKLKGLDGNAIIRFDENGIPSIEADSIHDVVFAQGWVHAKDRLWQMDINRRRSSGRMAELFGKGSVNGDYNSYLAGLPQVSAKIWAECLPAECDSYQAYSDGVNAYIAGMTEPPEEYSRIGAVPEAWSPVDSVAIGRGMSWGLSSDLGLEIMLGVLAKTIGNALLMDLLPLDGVDPITIVGDGSLSSFPAENFDENILAALDQPIFSSGRMNFGPGDRKSTRLNSSHRLTSRMPSSA